jgi:excisionase family DNA binding protein
MMTIDDDDDLLTIEEAMRKLKCKRTKIYSLARERRLDLVKFDRKTRITARSVDRLIRDILEARKAS